MFDGTRAPYADDDALAPLGLPVSKALGEAVVRATSSRFLVRADRRSTELARGRHRRHGRGSPAEAVRLFVDQWRTPLEVGEAAELLVDLLEGRTAGVINVAGPERVSRRELGLALAGALGLDTGLCEAGHMAEAGLAPRPADVALDVTRLCEETGRVPRGVLEGCVEIAARLAQGS
ncbi:MAG: sugar nucleotide-binding protein [Planctomycetota bacterium]